MKVDAKGLIIKSNAGLYDVYLWTSKHVIQTKSRGLLRHRALQPMVGDHVRIEMRKQDTPVITTIFPRKNQLIRPFIANIDMCLVVISVKEPPFQQYLLDKYVALLTFHRIEPIIIMTKYDLLEPAEAAQLSYISAYYQKIGYPCFRLADRKLQAKPQLNALLANKVNAIMGQTGVGKTTLLNDLADHAWELETSAISHSLGRGKHTTRIVELFSLHNYWIADTPGFSSFTLADIPLQALTETFVEFSKYPCQFNDCVHINETRCGVKTAVAKGEILPERYESYRKLYAEIQMQEEGKKW